MVTGVCNIGKTFYKCLVNLGYENLSKLQKEIYDQVMKIIPKITSSDVLVWCLFNAPTMKIPKNTKSDVIKVLSEEKINLKQGTVTGIIECHEQQMQVTKNGKTRMVMQTINYIQCSNCQIAISQRSNFMKHKCKKHLLKEVLNLPCT